MSSIESRLTLSLTGALHYGEPSVESKNAVPGDPLMRVAAGSAKETGH
jgi:hypothetical protein